MEVLKDISQLTKGCLVTFIKNDKFHFYEYLMVHPNCETYYLFIDNWTQEVVRIHVSELLNGDYYIGKYDTVFVNRKMIEFYKRMIQCHEKRIKESLKKKIVMATYRIVDMYRKSKAVKGIHYDSWNEPIFAYRVDKRHSLHFGLIHYWDYGAYNLCPDYLFPSIDKAKDAILKVDKSRRVTILYK